MCYVAEDFEREVAEAAACGKADQDYQLPDGQTITVGSERFRWVAGSWWMAWMVDWWVLGGMHGCPARMDG